jgi:hypothetical protein
MPAAISGQFLLNHLAFHVGQLVMAALKLKRAAGVIDAKAAQYCGVQIVHVHAVADDVIAIFVGLAMGDARADTATGEHLCRCNKIHFFSTIAVSLVTISVFPPRPQASE